MPIYVVTGKPGSGKSLFAVRHLRLNYLEFKEDPTIGYRIKEGYQIVSNISGLTKRVPQVRFLEDVLEYYYEQDKSKKDEDETDEKPKKKEKADELPVNHFFKYKVQKALTESDYPLLTKETENNPDMWPTKKVGDPWKIIYLIDEAQQLWSSRHTTDYKDSEQEVSLYFQKHRHLGHTIYVMTQEITTLWPKIWKIAEMEIRAVPATVCPPGFLIYKYKVPHTQCIDKTKLIRKDKKDFGLYKSFEVEESEKQGKNFKLMAIPIILLFIFVSFYYTYKGFKQLEKKVRPSSAQTQTQQSSDYRQAGQSSGQTQTQQSSDYRQAASKKREILTKLNIIKLYQGDKVISSKVVDPDSGNMVELKEYIAQAKREIKIMNSEVYVYLPEETNRDRGGTQNSNGRIIDVGL